MLNLLLPIDGTKRSKESIDWVKKRFNPSDVNVTLLFVREDWNELRSKEQYDLAKEEISPLLRESADTLVGFDVKTEIRFGKAGEEILSYAKDHEINTIVMTKSTRSGWVQMIGSVTAHVVKYAHCVVVIVPELYSIYE